jgi:hypothetical protein
VSTSFLRKFERLIGAYQAGGGHALRVEALIDRRDESYWAHPYQSTVSCSARQVGRFFLCKGIRIALAQTR